MTQTEPQPEPSPTESPLFASDEEALAAAEEAYRAYLDVENVIFAEGGVQPERIEEVAVREALQAAREGFESMKEKGYRAIGEAAFDSVELQQYASSQASEQDLVFVYMCLDFTNQDVLNLENKSVVNPDRQDRQPAEVGFDRSADGSGLILSSRNPWTGEEVC
ncbi:hypothetical protein HD599_000826 [Conyzicola lurida]|uniref:Uncharacterized protein n=1 Tax=Conyzicola lurida TaxID=1172621 RepID=A0A841ALJ3_9MICO|nr:hypothetical protein [Conyzicola lurida]MBB5842503.1 hypothetical protein [Conyzicola lurida]